METDQPQQSCDVSVVQMDLLSDTFPNINAFPFPAQRIYAFLTLRCIIYLKLGISKQGFF